MRLWKRNEFLFSLTKNKLRYDECVKILHTFTRDIVEKRRAAIANDTHNDDNNVSNGENEIGIKKKMALLDVLLKSTINGQPLSNADIVEEVDTFMFEGHDTVTAATCFSLYLLSQNIEAQQKVYEEVMKIVGDDLSIFPSYSQLLDMKFLECCVKETLRLFPSVPIIGRCLDEDLEVDGKLIPAGCNMNVMIYFINRDERYFPNPEEFIPERHLDVSYENPYVFIPFSAGPR